MTTTGRILLLVTLALSLLFACWGVAIYSNRVDFSGKDGIYNKRTAQLKEMEDARKLAEVRWASALAALDAEEQQRPKWQDFYKTQLEGLRAAKGTVVSLEIKDGVMVIGADGKPKTGAAIKGLAGLSDELAERENELRKLIDDTDKLIQEEKRLDTVLGNGKDPGLRLELAKWEDRRRRALAEQEKLEPLLYNNLVEAQSLTERQKTLQARLKELRAVAVTRKP